MFIGLLKNKLSPLVILIFLVSCGQPPKHGGFTPSSHNPIPNPIEPIITPIIAPTDNPNNPNGGQDSGGSNTIGSNGKFIEATLADKARLHIELLNIIEGLNSSEFPAKDQEFIAKWMVRYKASKVDLGKILNQIHLQDVCFDKQGTPKSASVKEFKIDSEICLSRKELAKIPSESLRKQLHILLLHEISHLLGYLEDDAKRLQTIALAHYDILFRNNAKTKVKEIFIRNIIVLKIFLENTINQPDQYFTNGAILKDNKFFEDCSSQNHLVLPVLDGTIKVMRATLDSQLQENPDLDVEKIQKELSILEPMFSDFSDFKRLINIISITRLRTSTDTLTLKHPDIKDGNFLSIKKYFQTVLTVLENISFIKDELAQLKWQYEEESIAAGYEPSRPLVQISLPSQPHTLILVSPEYSDRVRKFYSTRKQ